MKDKVLYCLILRDDKFIADYPKKENFKLTILEEIVTTLQKNQKLIMTTNKGNIFYHDEKGTSVFCIVTPESNKSEVWVFIKQIEEFLRYEKDEKKIQWYLQDLYNKTKDDISNIEQVKKLQEKVNETKDKMLQNQIHLIENMEKAKEIEEESDQLFQNAQAFSEKAKKLKKKNFFGMVSDWISHFSE
eukprot:gene8620-567_t